MSRLVLWTSHLANGYFFLPVGYVANLATLKFGIERYIIRIWLPIFDLAHKLSLCSVCQARQFRKTWVTPPSPKYTDRRRAVAEIRRSDYEKGLERIGR